MKTVVWIIALTFLSGPVFPQKSISKYPLTSIAELGKTPGDTVRLKVYIFDIYICPPCPHGMQCKPCDENNFTALDKKPVDIFKIPQNERLRVYTPHPDSLSVGKRYLITIRFRNRKTSPSNNIELVSFKPL